MANTVIQIKNSGTTGNTPATLNTGELAINYADGKLFYGNASNTAVLFDAITEPAGLNQEIQFNDSGVFGAAANLKYDSSSEILYTTSVNATQNLETQIAIVHNKLYAGLATDVATELPNVIAQFTSDAQDYTQVNQQNINGNGSADFVITADVGTDTDFYADMGMAGSTYSFYDGYETPFDPLTGYFLVQGSTIGQDGGNMVIGTTTPGTNVRFLVGGFENSNIALALEETEINVHSNLIVQGTISGPTITTMQNYTQSAFNKANSANTLAQSAYDYVTSIPAGPQGAQGLTGAQGAQGYQGDVGAQGFQGAVGAQGLTGAQGAQGYQGDVGAQGFQGAVGAQGAIGAQGSQGFQGDVGAQGSIGAQGSVGAQGAQGSQGFQGEIGLGYTPGGNTGQVFVKNSNADYDTIWTNTLQGDFTIDGNLTISGTQIITNTRELGVQDNMIYLNEAITANITNAVGDGANVVYTTSANHNFSLGGSIRVTGIDPSTFNLTSTNTIIALTSNTFTVASNVTSSYVSGGFAYYKIASNPDLGFSGGYTDGTYAHAGIFRDATDGIFKVFYNYIPEPGDSIFIDTGHPSFRIANLTANLVTNVITLRGLDPLDYANTKVSKSGDILTGDLTTSGAIRASSVASNTTVTINTHSVLESTSITTSSTSQVTLDSFATATYRSAKYLVQLTSGSAYHMIELNLVHDGTTVHLAQYGEVRTGASLGTFDASISAGTLSVLVTPTNSSTVVKAYGTLITV